MFSVVPIKYLGEPLVHVRRSIKHSVSDEPPFSHRFQVETLRNENVP